MFKTTSKKTTLPTHRYKGQPFELSFDTYIYATHHSSQGNLNERYNFNEKKLGYIILLLVLFAESRHSYPFPITIFKQVNQISQVQAQVLLQ